MIRRAGGTCHPRALTGTDELQPPDEIAAASEGQSDEQQAVELSASPLVRIVAGHRETVLNTLAELLDASAKRC